METLIPTLIIVLISVVLLGVKVLFVKGGRFPSGHAHDIEARRREALKRAGSNIEKPKINSK